MLQINVQLEGHSSFYPWCVKWRLGQKRSTRALLPQPWHTSLYPGPASTHVTFIEHEDGDPKNLCFQIAVWEKNLESPLDCKEIKPVNPQWNQLWIFIERTDAEAETPILWLPDVKSPLIGKDAETKKDWGQKEKGATEDKMVGWHHWFSGHEFEQALGDTEGQRSWACCSPWGHKEMDMT